ncbi:MAG: hypothetical protein ACKVJU_02000 [Verrucomicrobiales bacterium]
MNGTDPKPRKRGGGQILISLDEKDAEARYLIEPADPMTAERLFERRWAMTLFDLVLERLREEMSASGKLEVFEALKDHLMAGSKAPFAEIGLKLGMSEGNARVTAHRLKKKCRELLREEIAQTVAERSEVEEEIRYLISILSGRSE